MDKIINIAQDFSETPGARYISDGPFSGEEFRKKCLERYFEDPKDSTMISIYLDGTEGYATSFLEEAFGGLVREYGKKKCLSRIKLFSIDDLLVEEIESYMNEAVRGKRARNFVNNLISILNLA